MVHHLRDARRIDAVILEPLHEGGEDPAIRNEPWQSALRIDFKVSRAALLIGAELDANGRVVGGRPFDMGFSVAFRARRL
jgi:hypothetical protein